MAAQTTRVSGVEAVGHLASTNVWGKIDPANTPEYVTVESTQAAGWSAGTPAYTPEWVDVLT